MLDKIKWMHLAEEFTLAPMRRLLKKFGDLKISEEAAEEMRRAVGEYALSLAESVVESVKRDNRKTVLERDIRVALNMDKKLEH